MIIIKKKKKINNTEQCYNEAHYNTYNNVVILTLRNQNRKKYYKNFNQHNTVF